MSQLEVIFNSDAKEVTSSTRWIKYRAIKYSNIANMAEKQGEPIDDQQQPTNTSSVPVNAWQPATYQQGSWSAQPQQPIILVVPATGKPRIWSNYRSKPSHALGIIQIVAALLGIIFFSIGFWLQVGGSLDYEDYVDDYNDQGYYWEEGAAYYPCAGAWGAVFFILSGAFAIHAAKIKTTWSIVTHMVMSILATSSAIIMFAFGTWAVVDDASRLHNGFSYTKHGSYDYQYDKYNDAFYDGYPVHDENIYYDYDAENRGKACLAISVMVLLVSIVEVVACLWSSTLTCRACCCGSATEDRVKPGIQYMAAPGSGQQPQLIYLGAPHNGQILPAATGGQAGMQGMFVLPPNDGVTQQGGVPQHHAENNDSPPPYQ